MAQINFSATTVVAQYTGCKEGAGQDYLRMESDDRVSGIAELHLAFDTSGSLLRGVRVTLSSNNAALVGTFDRTISSAVISTIGAGTVYNTVVAISGANALVLHIPRLVAHGWIIGNSINVGIRAL